MPKQSKSHSPISAPISKPDEVLSLLKTQFVEPQLGNLVWGESQLSWEDQPLEWSEHE